MDSSLVLITYFLLFLQIVLIELLRHKGKFFDFFSVVNFIFLLVYTITPIYYELWSDENIYSHVNNSYEVLIYTIIGYQFLWLGWVLGTYKRTSLVSLNKIGADIKWINASVSALWIVFVLFVILTLDRGGLSQSIGAGALSRYNYEEIETSRFAFFSRIVSLSPFLTAIFLFYLIKPNLKYSRHKIKLYYLFSFCISLLQTFIGASRGGLLRLFLLQFLVFVLVKRNIKIINLVAVSFLILLVISYGKHTFYAVSNFFYYGESLADSFAYMNTIRGTDDKGTLDIFFTEFSHPIKSLNVAVQYSGDRYSFTYFADFVWSILRILPQRLTSLMLSRPDTVTSINTYLITDNYATSIPPGIIGTFYYSLGSVGVIIGMFSYGFIGSVFNKKLLIRQKENPVYIVPFVFFAFFYGFFVTNGDPNVYVYYILMPIVFLLVVSRKKTLKF